MVPSKTKTIIMRRAESAVLAFRKRVTLAHKPKDNPCRKKRPAKLLPGLLVSTPSPP